MPHSISVLANPSHGNAVHGSGSNQPCRAETSNLHIAGSAFSIAPPGQIDRLLHQSQDISTAQPARKNRLGRFLAPIDFCK